VKLVSSEITHELERIIIVNSQMPMKPFGVHDLNRYSELPKEKKAHVIFSMGIMNTQHERPTLFSFVH
jgi:hypothetical protein